MRDYSKLIGLIVEKCNSKREFAEKLGLSETTIYMKLNNKLEFKQGEIDKTCVILGISRDEIPLYFFTHKVQ